MRRFALALACLSLALARAGAVDVGVDPHASAPPVAKPMGVHNRLLLDRLTVNGHRTVQVMLAVKAMQLGRLVSLVAQVGGQVRRSEPAVGYVRAEVPIERLDALVSDGTVEAYQLSSLAGGAWYSDTRPRMRAEFVRDAEQRPVVGTMPPGRHSELPPLSIEQARKRGYTADDDSGVGKWYAEHPTFDGRGVTIALLETAQAAFDHPSFRSARAIDGVEVPKIAGILNAVGPDVDDETRVELDTWVEAASPWVRLGLRTYILPAPGVYRFGVFRLSAGSSLVHQFGIVRNESTGQVFVDTDGDTDFHDEVPVHDVNTRYDVRHLRLSHPREATIAFVMALGRTPRQVHIYTAQSAHQSMTVSVAAGNPTADSLASGVAPGARVLLVRYLPARALHTVFEGYLEAIQRPDVDILCDSSGLGTIPDTAHDFAGVFFRRLIATYGKPIFHSAGNAPRLMGNVSSLGGGVFSVGGAIGPATFSAFYGGGSLARPMVHPWSAAGPGLDGALVPDFIAPANRISAGVSIAPSSTALPTNAPAVLLPQGYEISCCTSASSPYAAGVAALLLSAAKQQGLTYSVASVGRALRVGSRFLPDWPAHQQGNGLLDVGAAWIELQRSPVVPRIRIDAPVVHPLAPYYADGPHGPGLLEQEGWRTGMRGERVLTIHRESGQPGPISYRLSWTGNDDTFSAPATVSLRLNEAVRLPVTIRVRTPGVHSAILNLHDPATHAIIARTATTIVAPESFDPRTRTVRFGGSLPLLRTAEHFVAVPPDASAISVELDVVRGAVSIALLPGHGLYRSYYWLVDPAVGRTFTKGKYRLLLPRPTAGPWRISASNISAWGESNPEPVSVDPAVYSVTMRVLSAVITLGEASPTGVAVEVANRGADLGRPVVETSPGTLRTRTAALLPSRLPNTFDVNVPEGTTTLALTVRAVDPDAGGLGLHLYECTTGECFSYDFTMAPTREHTFVVRKPQPGRWVATVSAAPVPGTAGRFVLEEIVAGAATRTDLEPSRSRGAASTHTVELPPEQAPASDGVPIVLCELFDVAAEQDAAANSWEPREGLSGIGNRKVAVGTAVLRLH